MHHLDEMVEHELSVVSSDQGQEHLLPEDSVQCELFAFRLRKKKLQNINAKKKIMKDLCNLQRNNSEGHRKVDKRVNIRKVIKALYENCAMITESAHK